MGVDDEDELIIVSRNGILIRLQGHDIATLGRNTQGVKVINLGENDQVRDVAYVREEEGAEGEGSEEDGTPTREDGDNS